MSEEEQGMQIEVIAYSGYKANERPLYFILGLQKIEIKKILDRWYGEEHDYFKVLADDDRLYLIRWHRVSDLWFLEKAMNGG